MGNRHLLQRTGAYRNLRSLGTSSPLVAGPLSLLALLFEGSPNFALPPAFYGQLLWLATISATAFAIWFHLLSKVKVSKLNLWKFIIPLCGAMLSWIFLPGEHPTVPSLIGMALIVAGIIIGQRR